MTLTRGSSYVTKSGKSLMSIFKGLNKEQADAVRSIHGPLLVFAGAGSGKTRVITHRIKHMVAQGVPPSSIIAVTFTNRSAKEMKSRLKQMMNRKDLRGMIVSTFHSLGNRILQKEIHNLPGYRHPFSIMTPDETINIFADIYRSLKMDPTEIKNDGIQFSVSLCKNSGMDPFDFAERNGVSVGADAFGEIFKRYQQMLNSYNSVDFDDLLILPQKVFETNPEVLERFRKRHRYYLVDEFQDTNPIQYNFMKMLVGSDKNICVVGDDDQSIYGWRGADVNIILGFQKDFPGAETVHLEYNYRSTGTILEAANAVIVRNENRVKKSLKATLGAGGPILGVMGEDEEREASLIADEIQKRIVKEKRHPGEFAILFRSNFQSRVFEQELRGRGVPVHVVGGYRFFDRREVRDMISYLRVVANPRDEISMKRIINRPRRGIGDATIKKINDYILSTEEEERPDFEGVIQRMMETPGLIPGIKAEAVAALREFLEFIEHYRRQFSSAVKLSPVLGGMIRELNFEMEFLRDGDNDNVAKARMLNLSELVNMLSFMESSWDNAEKPTLFDFLAQISMQAGDNENEDKPQEKVQLLTLHLSKGLEYPVVFLTGIEEGIFPAPRAIEESRFPDQALAEERRLFYVGITRARQQLYITCSATRRKYGEVMDTQPSRFLDELPEDLLNWIYKCSTEQVDEEEFEDNFLSGLASMRIEDEDE